MEIFTEPNYNPNLSIALGYFDGVHIGHKAVIENAVDFALKNGTKSAVITFKDHPCCYLWGVCPKYILTRKMREEKIAELKVDYLYELDFEELSKLSADEYLKNILINYFKPYSISTGWNYNFGYQKSGDMRFLKENSKNFGYEYFAISPQKIEKNIISSTEIRKYLSEGKVENANEMLGYKFSISGKVIEGNKIGRTIGFPTANIDYPAELIELPYGVYYVNVYITPILEESYKAIANYGLRPTINGNKPVLEVHILDFDEDIYGQNLTVEFIRMLRPEHKFDSLDELKEQIKLDISNL